MWWPSPGIAQQIGGQSSWWPSHTTEVEGRLLNVLLQGKMVCRTGSDKFAKDENVINGLNCWQAELSSGSADLVKIISDESDESLRIDLDCLTPGSFIAVEIEPL
jgi:hypothetical protein